MSTSRRSARLFHASVLLVLGVAAPADAANCDVTTCTSQLLAAPGLVVNDVFHDANGLDAQHVPMYGRVISAFPACPDQVDLAGAGQSLAPFDCPGEYMGVATTPTLANARTFLGALDRQWWQPCRLANPALVGGCVADWTCIADGTPGNYVPWEGLVFDLGGPASQVALFGDNDHAPQPCESLEYTVYFTDDPFAHDPTDIVLHPEVNGVDPTRWNRAVLSRVYTSGWTQVRAPDPAGHAACGDTAAYSVESDSFAQVFSLPCGITMRYVAVVPGNDGLDFPGCAYDSNEGELDAVVGLTASGAAVCPDGDGDGAVDCGCPGAPPVCDCNDADPSVHPGAPEACDATNDLNCDAMIGGCPGSRLCVAGACVRACDGTVGSCPPGTACSPGAQQACLPIDCGCASGEVCIGGSCVSACAGVVCPGSEVCRAGDCVDPCAGVACAAGEACDGGVCRFPCSCYAGDVGCAAGTTCDRGSTAACVVPACVGVTCSGADHCGASGACETFCSATTSCPALEHCVDPGGCVSLCTGVACTAPQTCNAATGACDDPTCRGVSCTAPASCVAGTCVTPDAGTDAGPADAGRDAGAVVGPDGGGMGTFDASARDAAATIDAGTTGAPPSNAGCGCRAGGARTAGRWLAGLVIVALVTRRRRRGAR